jgi:hypothetical protein
MKEVAGIYQSFDQQNLFDQNKAVQKNPPLIQSTKKQNDYLTTSIFS